MIFLNAIHLFFENISNLNFFACCLKYFFYRDLEWINLETDLLINAVLLRDILSSMQYSRSYTVNKQWFWSMLLLSFAIFPFFAIFEILRKEGDGTGMDLS